ncbi:MAG: hypothetical protein LBI84_05110 [Propionibacteriaceae bacterium]|nr:hypothetical protein [Propionibacteriaceae bacterium]
MSTVTAVYGLTVGALAWLGYSKAVVVVAAVGGMLVGLLWASYGRGGRKSSDAD